MALKTSQTKLKANWIFVEPEYCPGLAADYMCSNCKAITLTRYIEEYQYCHKCGAKMGKKVIPDRRQNR